MINKDKAKALRDDMKAALEAVCEKHGVKAAGVSCTYTETEVRINCKAEDSTEIAGVEWSPEEAAFLRQAHKYGLAPTDLGKEVEIQGNTWILCGLKPQNVKYPVLARRSWDGKLFKFAPADVVDAMSS